MFDVVTLCLEGRVVKAFIKKLSSQFMAGWEPPPPSRTSNPTSAWFRLMTVDDTALVVTDAGSPGIPRKS